MPLSLQRFVWIAVVGAVRVVFIDSHRAKLGVLLKEGQELWRASVVVKALELRAGTI
jgi:hypothetical protein